MTSPTRSRVRFDNPPVAEVTCGVLFTTPQPIQCLHIGLFWQKIKNAFPQVQEAIPLPPIIEILSSQGGIPQSSITFGLRPLPTLRRTWFISEDGQNLIQVQEDRFLFNWKRGANNKPYPSYDDVIQKFEKYHAEFRKFLVDEKIGHPNYHQLELTYINHIGNEQGINEDTVLIDHVRKGTSDRFLSKPEGVNWTSIYPLPNNTGRLYCTAQSVNSITGERILRLDLSGRGISSDPTERGIRSWFDMAHESITHGFADITDPEVQKNVWKRTA